MTINEPVCWHRRKGYEILATADRFLTSRVWHSALKGQENPSPPTIAKVEQEAKGTVPFLAPAFMKKFSILHTIQTGGPGGAESVVLNLASGLDSSRFRSVVLLPRKGWLSERLQERSIPTYFVNSKAWFDLRLPLGIARVVRQEKIDLIHSHLPGQNFYSCVAGRLTGRKTIATYHGPIELIQSRGLRGAIQLGWVRRSAAAVVVVCDKMRRMLLNLKFPPGKIVLIYNGISLDRFQASANGRLKEELGVETRAKLVGMVANFRESKGYEFYIRAARRVLITMPETRFVAVGHMDPLATKPFVSLVEELGIQDRFTFLGFRSDIPEILSGLDLFVLSSVNEGFPLVTLEAMAAGKPAVVTRCGGPEEVVDDGRTGLLVPPGDVDALAAGIIAVLSDPERSAAMGRNARSKVENGFTLGKMIQEYEELYCRYLNAP